MTQPSPKQLSGRYTELDALRGIAALAVVIYHYSTIYDVIFTPATPFFFTFEYGALGVHLFFIISGFVILLTARRYRTPTAFLAARGIRLYPTYWAALTISVAVVVCTQTTRLFVPPGQIAANYTMFQSFMRIRHVDGAYWTLTTELIFYALITASLVLTHGMLSNRFVCWLAAAWASGGTLLCLTTLVKQSTWQNLIIDGTAGQYAPLFGLGMVLLLSKEAGRLHPLTWYLTALAVLNQTIMTSIGQGIVVFLIALALVYITSHESVPWLRVRWLVWFGKISYPLYVLHQNIGYSIIHATIDTVGVLGSRIIAFVLVIGLSVLVHEIFEVRASKKLNALLKKRLARG